jgi:hypothetical protein
VIDKVKLTCIEFNARLYLPREGRMQLREPQELRRNSYRPTLNFDRELRWLDDAKADQLLSNEDVMNRIIGQLLALIDRLNNGKVPSRDYD